MLHQLITLATSCCGWSSGSASGCGYVLQAQFLWCWEEDGWHWCGIEGGGGVEGGGAEVGQPNDAKPNFTMIRVLRRRGYSPYTRYIIGISWRNSADTKNFIYGIGWHNTADTNNLLYWLAYVSWYQQSSAYKYHPHTTVPTKHTVAAATILNEGTVPTEIIPLFWGIFSTFSNMCLPLFCHCIYRSWF
jgi:hypothetical protein